MKERATVRGYQARLIETRTIIPRRRGIDAKFSKQALANHNGELIKLIKLKHLSTNENYCLLLKSKRIRPQIEH